MVTNSEFNQKLLIELKTRILQKADQINFLIGHLDLTKEAAYRRLRGAVPFTFTEAAIIAEKLGISLDYMIGVVANESGILFRMNTATDDLNTLEDYSNNYYRLVYRKYEQAHGRYMKQAPQRMICASNIIPYILLQFYPHLACFNAFKWAYQMYPGKYTAFSLQNIERYTSAIRTFTTALYRETDLIFIFSRSMFTTFFDQIKFFYKLQLISDDYYIEMKNELLNLVSSLEHIAIRGRSENIQNVWIHLSDINIENGCIYTKSENSEEVFIFTFHEHVITSTDPKACEMAKNWITSLMKYTTLISVSGEMERRLFFEEQRKYILSVDD